MEGRHCCAPMYQIISPLAEHSNVPCTYLTELNEVKRYHFKISFQRVLESRGMPWILELIATISKLQISVLLLHSFCLVSLCNAIFHAFL